MTFRLPVFFLSFAIVLGAMTKRAQIPFSSWLPAAMAAPTPVSSLVHSSTLVTAGVYLIIRFYPSLSLYQGLFYFLFYVGVVTTLMAGLSALYENDLKKVVAFSTLRQLGLMFMGLGLTMPLLSFFHLITHALFKALLFICAGTIIHCMGNNQDMRLMGSLWLVIPVVCVSMNVANLALCGFPFVAGFYSKDLVVESSVYINLPFITVMFMVLRLVLTGAYSLRLSFFRLWGSYKGSALLSFNDESRITSFSLFPLLLGAVIGGRLFYWVLFPFVGLMVMPVSIKFLVLFFLFLAGLLTYISVYGGWVYPVYYFMGSIWFLSFISSFPLVFKIFSVGDLFYSQELSWMEMLRGKGALSLVGIPSSFLQEAHNFFFSRLFSLFTLIFGFLVLFY